MSSRCNGKRASVLLCLAVLTDVSCRDRSSGPTGASSAQPTLARQVPAIAPVVAGWRVYVFPSFNLKAELPASFTGTVMAGSLPLGLFASKPLSPTRDATAARGELHAYGSDGAFALRWLEALDPRTLKEGRNGIAIDRLNHEIGLIQFSDKTVSVKNVGETPSHQNGHVAIWKQYTRFDDASPGHESAVLHAVWYCDQSKRFLSLSIKNPRAESLPAMAQQFLDGVDCHHHHEE